MGLFEFSGDNVHLFLNTITTNDVSLLVVGQSQYSFLLDQDGHVLDDVWIYRLEPERYWMVVNAANNDKDWAWINAVRDGRVQIDPARPWSRALGTETVVIRDMRDPSLGSDMRAQLALQGPRSRDILLALLDEGDPLREAAAGDEAATRSSTAGWRAMTCTWPAPATPASRWPLRSSSTRPRRRPCGTRCWRPAQTFGLQPAGLAARDSLRIEAGLPLYGHELAGPLDLNPADAGFPPYVKLYKPFFVGKAAFMAHEHRRQARLVRFRFDEEHARVPKQGDVIVNRKGRVVGAVTSCSIDSDGWLTGLAYVQEQYAKIDTRLGVFQVDSKAWAIKPLADLKTGDQVQLHDAITVIKRFLNKKE